MSIYLKIKVFIFHWPDDSFTKEKSITTILWNLPSYLELQFFIREKFGNKRQDLLNIVGFDLSNMFSILDLKVVELNLEHFIYI